MPDKGKIQKIMVTLVTTLGLTAVFFGMTYKNNAIFITGLILVLGGYLFIRRKLKASINDRYR